MNSAEGGVDKETASIRAELEGSASIRFNLLEIKFTRKRVGNNDSISSYLSHSRNGNLIHHRITGQGGQVRDLVGHIPGGRRFDRKDAPILFEGDEHRVSAYRRQRP